MIDEKGFYALTAEKMNEVMNTTPVSLEDASLNTWVHPVDGTAYIYYPKGSLAGLMLDVMIRDASDNKRSLDDVMRGLYESTYKHGRGFTPAEWWSAVTSAAGGKSFASFNARYIDGREPFPGTAFCRWRGSACDRSAFRDWAFSRSRTRTASSWRTWSTAARRPLPA